MEWFGFNGLNSPRLRLCARCCAHIAPGFIQDLLVMKAKHDIEVLTGRQGILVTSESLTSAIHERRRYEETSEELEACKRQLEEPDNGD